jgi:hypothetical protein
MVRCLQAEILFTKVGSSTMPKIATGNCAMRLPLLDGVLTESGSSQITPKLKA